VLFFDVCSVHDMSSLNLRSKLRASGMSQFDLSRASGVHPSQISRACSGMQLSADAERRVLEVLDPPTDAVTFGTARVAVSDAA
jgi:transcriptional regulator with XRE-family HTH domain